MFIIHETKMIIKNCVCYFTDKTKQESVATFKSRKTHK